MKIISTVYAVIIHCHDCCNHYYGCSSCYPILQCYPILLLLLLRLTEARLASASHRYFVNHPLISVHSDPWVGCSFPRQVVQMTPFMTWGGVKTMLCELRQKPIEKHSSMGTVLAVQAWRPVTDTPETICVCTCMCSMCICSVCICMYIQMHRCWGGKERQILDLIILTVSSVCIH